MRERSPPQSRKSLLASSARWTELLRVGARIPYFGKGMFSLQCPQQVLSDYLYELARKKVSVEGIVLTGGCALNVVVNQQVRDSLTEATSERPNPMKPQDVYVPPAPNDSGLTVGGVWAVSPPAGPRQKLQYLGFHLWDLEILDLLAEERGAKRLSALGGVHFLAELLCEKRERRPILALVRGRQEFGPRALGHRSLLAVPDAADLRDRMNRLKFRQWYRPVAPMIAEEGLEEVFGHKYTSPSMEFAPLVREEVRERFPALAHFDGTARHQSVSKQDEPWAARQTQSGRSSTVLQAMLQAMLRYASALLRFTRSC